MYVLRETLGLTEAGSDEEVLSDEEVAGAAVLK
jgi:hypothetical protein